MPLWRAESRFPRTERTGKISKRLAMRPKSPSRRCRAAMCAPCWTLRPTESPSNWENGKYMARAARSRKQPATGNCSALRRWKLPAKPSHRPPLTIRPGWTPPFRAPCWPLTLTPAPFRTPTLPTTSYTSRIPISAPISGTVLPLKHGPIRPVSSFISAASTGRPKYT